MLFTKGWSHISVLVGIHIYILIEYSTSSSNPYLEEATFSQARGKLKKKRILKTEFHSENQGHLVDSQRVLKGRATG